MLKPIAFFSRGRICKPEVPVAELPSSIPSERLGHIVQASPDKIRGAAVSGENEHAGGALPDKEVVIPEAKGAGNQPLCALCAPRGYPISPLL